MKLTFVGTRGYIEPKSRRHRHHTALMVAYRGKRVMIDCGETWLGEWRKLNPRAIVLTHAHPDHAHGLEEGAEVPVWADEKTWELIDDFPIENRQNVKHRERFEVEGIGFEAFPVEHSTRCPAVGYRIDAGRVTVFYCPDVVYIWDREAALKGAKTYIGDGATMKGQFVRRQEDRLIGHTTVQTQVTWCEKEGVPRFIVTHCGSEIVKGDERKLGAQVARWGREKGVEAEIAHDGMEVVLR